MTANNRLYEMEYGDPKPRRRVGWMLEALRRARQRHLEFCGEYPHTVYLHAPEWARLWSEVREVSDCSFMELPLVLGMRVELEPC